MATHQTEKSSGNIYSEPVDSTLTPLFLSIQIFKYPRKEIPLLLDHCGFRWEIKQKKLENKLHLKIFLSQEFFLGINLQETKSNFIKIEAYFHHRDLEKIGFQKERVIEGESFVEDLEKIIDLYLKFYAENQKKIKLGVLNLNPKIQKIKNIPKWEEVRFLKSLKSQIEADSEISEKQEKVLENIKRERTYSQKEGVRKKRAAILEERVVDSNVNSEIKEIKNKIKEGKFLSKWEKDLIADLFVKENLFEKIEKGKEGYKWGPYVDGRDPQ